MSQDNIFSLQGKSILVSGASSGIGRTIAIILSRQGANVFITGRNEQRLMETSRKLDGSGHNVIIADLTRGYDLQKISDKVTPLDGIVFCAGIIDYMIAKNIDMTSLDDIMTVNFKSQIALYQKLHQNRKLNKNSSLVFISSVSAISAVPATLAYAASKAAINSSVRILASELAKSKIRVNSISPGLIESPLLQNSVLEKESIETSFSKYPLGPGKEEDVANTAVFLLSDASRWITGTTIIVDGGYMLNN
ncbi:MAG: SDR family oxidoreductase [Bacteroidales bacterium]|jgi:NAD(P)-dependent dehydrogenase (short-subunit alcohol dehydrogenase family)